MYGYVAVDHAPGLWGGYAQHQYLAPDSMLCPVPATLDAVTATLFNPLGAGIRWGVTMPGTRAGDVVARLGLADVRAFGLTWEDCEAFLSRLGYRAKIDVFQST